ncbi:hypothetical protein, partial [Salinimicrobium gaetbulicola]
MRDFTVPGMGLIGFYACWRWLVPKIRSVSAFAGTSVLVGLIFLWMPSAANAQEVTLSTSIQAGFGIDADVESDVFRNSLLDGEGTDDWFTIPYLAPNPDGNPATGAAVIEYPSMQDFNALQSGANEIFELRMNADLYSMPENDGVIWIDAVYYRDQRTDGDKKDMTVFDQQINKNYNDPTTWTFKTGDVPQKNDIVDVFGHLRRAADGDQYAIVAASTRNADGDSYLDFEYYREEVTLNASKTSLITAGEDCGHTAYEFDLIAEGENEGDGSVLEHGDIIMSVNYTKGGDAVDIRLFVWIDKRDFPTNQDFADFNLLPERPFNFGSASGGFVFYPCDNDPSKNYGYARISLKSGTPKLAVFAQSNNDGTVPAPDWGTINDAGDVVDFYQTNTLAELALNSTLFGFDTQSDNIFCDSPLGSVIVKSRSSDAFTSSLKDFAGPFQLGDTPEVTVEVENGSYECFETSTTLTADVTPLTGTFKYQWYEWIDDAYVEIEGATNASLENVTEGTYKFKATILIGGNEGCFAEAEGISVIQNDPAEILEASCPENVSLPACTAQTEIDAAFDTWKNSLSYEGGGGEVTAVYYLNGQVVDNLDRLTPPEFCGGSVSIGISVTDECGQESSCSTTFTIAADETPVALTPIDDYMLEDCNAEWPANLTTSWTDNCGVGGMTSGNLDSDGGGEVSTDGCIQSRDYTFSVTDDCGNYSELIVTVSREFDETPVALTPIDDYMLEDCNAEWPANLTTSWTDNCGVGGQTSGNLDSDGGGEVSTDGCIQSRDYTFSVTDDCGNYSELIVTVSREFDETPVALTPIDDYMLEDCNAEWPANLTTSWTDNCGVGGQTSGNLDSDGGGEVSTDGCIQSRDYTFSVTDDCGNYSEMVVTVSREFDETPVALTPIDDYMLEDCNAEWPANLTTSWTDNCGVGGQTSGNLDSDGGGEVSTDGCIQSRDYTFSVTDDCGNYSEMVVTVSREFDETPVALTPIDDYMLEDCNAEWPANLTTSWTDNCGVGGMTSGNLDSDGGGEVSTDGCIQSRDYTFSVTDDCGNYSEMVVTVSREFDETPVALTPIDDYMLEDCNAEWPANLTTSWTDNCGVGGMTSGNLDS